MNYSDTLTVSVMNKIRAHVVLLLSPLLLCRTAFLEHYSCCKKKIMTIHFTKMYVEMCILDEESEVNVTLNQDSDKLCANVLVTKQIR